MIEILNKDRCVNCNQCVTVCPTNVFDPATEPDGVPVIARKSDCQSCFMCELYCPADALYVAPFAERDADLNESELIHGGLLGSYRKDVGWNKGARSTASEDESYILFKRMHSH
ncbi:MULTISPECIES: 4Fe-4S dicluster domain-containing protein [Paenibacillus]|uniref:4Fe-4S ferredoxin n=1 Tax=Paenibacillus naphthalenovorans TaxID=162209 RepID=A0A0U2UBM1_9BACL|nr:MULTISPECIES: ferredoxin family protein [Paenibacillus]ALS20572.1 4Fe-4S ferredoxin [Paenibacillus naphthalenovorans]GCL73128.1 ferredoxin family protein [Paenibacillus naphthalenovorans]